MNRRGFLKLFGLGTAAITLPKTLLAFGERATETVKASVEKIKAKFTPKKIKPVGKQRISAEYLANHCNVHYCKQNPWVNLYSPKEKHNWKTRAKIFDRYLNDVYTKWTKKENDNEHIA